ncbi:membrane-bound lytic murein transglycosylase MltF [Mangrovimicrobium sediminis]|uniref:Membrane-bound lytic murein transglycosylase F n=1 Tax=Mangrovimicrobium sediminis TaxID=2562682 RepID=A0A4Z0M3K5_9GAMM|nr:membrane-bound lytic murein transglycosylase MltF [Haliea sp. SAOS-164]TGD73948.1 membrane-bound lytic murein transglycosylase MltF [Haliea sp. SAOS-164]
MPRVATITLLVLSCLLGACSRQDNLEQILEKGQLRVVSRNSPTTWYEDRNGSTGFEYTLASLFAEDLGVELVMVPAFSLPDIFVRLERNDADIAAAGLLLDPELAPGVPHSMPYASNQPEVIYMSGTFRPRQPEDMLGMSIVTLAGSAHNRHLEQLREEGLEGLQWREIDAADSMELLDMVNTGKAQLAVLNSSEFAVQKGLYPRLKTAFDLGPERQLVWHLRPGGDNQALLARIDAFLQRMLEEGRMQALREEQFSLGQQVAQIGSHTFTRKMRDTLPDYLELIREVAAEYKMDWQLIAAVAYQESHWNPLAQSPTGVRGMMMLTEPTAREMGVEDRLDPAESLRGGVRYLKNMIRRLPTDIGEPDRTFMALAAYNIGRAHLEDARVLTERQGGDPHIWSDVMLRLPLLENRKYYNEVRHGYARGQEAVTYVQNIRHYRSILEWEDLTSNRPAPPVHIEDYLPEVLRGVSLRSL